MSAVTIRLTESHTGRAITIDTEGREVAPGLAVTPFFYNANPETDRFSITHVESGKLLGGPFCAHRVDEAVQIAILSRVDWTESPDDLKASAAPKVKALLQVMTHVCDACFASAVAA